MKSVVRLEKITAVRGFPLTLTRLNATCRPMCSVRHCQSPRGSPVPMFLKKTNALTRRWADEDNQKGFETAEVTWTFYLKLVISENVLCLGIDMINQIMKFSNLNMKIFVLPYTDFHQLITKLLKNVDSNNCYISCTKLEKLIVYNN